MEPSLFNFKKKNIINKNDNNDNNILLEIINELHQIIDSSQEKITIKKIKIIITKMNFFIKETRKNLQ